MDRTEDVEQLIWEFVYELLPEDEAEEVNRRITSEPDVARVYAEVKMQTDLLAKASKVEQPPIPFKQLLQEADNASDQQSRKVSLPARPLSTAARAANWLVGLAASALVCIVGYSYVKTDSPVREVVVSSHQQSLVAGHVRTTLFGPERVQPRPANYFTVLTRSADGQPRPVDLAYRFYDAEDNLLLSRQAQTDTGGLAQIETPQEIDSSNVRLEVETKRGLAVQPVERELPVADVELTTHLTTDKPLYRPGETIRYRSVTLSRYGLRVRREVTVEFRVLNPSGAEVSGSRSSGDTEHGVGRGQFAIPADQPGGKYTLVARSSSDEFPEARRDFYVRQYRTPTLKKRLEFVHDSFAPGDEVVADFSVERAEGGAVANAPLRILAEVDGRTMLNLHTAANESGAYKVRFALPREMQKGDGLLTVTVNNGTQETITRPIPVTRGDVSVEFSPESGDLVAGVVNRVYFHARDSADEPAHVEGRILDSRDQQVAKATTIHKGRGKFSFTPLSDEVYRLQIDTPTGAVDERPLPTTSDEQFVTMNTGPGVFDAGQPLELQVQSTQCSKPLAIAAVCRGAVAGQQVVSGDQFVSSEAGIGSCDVAVPLAQHADGVIRLTVYDLSARPPLPVAERLVYRRPQQRLEIQIADLDESYSPGDQVDLSLAVQDENGVSQEAVLGVSVVDDALVSLADDKSTRMTTHFWLTSQINKPEDLEDANFYLKEDTESAAALDLLLGTQGWRRFARVPLDRLAGAPISALAGAQRPSEPTETSLAVAEPAAPRILADNGREAHAALERTVRDYHISREVDLRRTGQVVFSGGVAVLIALVIMGLLRLIGGMKVWVPAAFAASICLIMGWQWMGAVVDTQGRLARLPRVPKDGEVQVAQVDMEEPESRMLLRQEGALEEVTVPAKAVEKSDFSAGIETKEELAETAREAVPKAAPAPAGPPAAVVVPAPAAAASRPAPAAEQPAPAPMAEQPAPAPTAEQPAPAPAPAEPVLGDRDAGFGGGGFGMSATDKLEKVKKKGEMESITRKRRYGMPAAGEPVKLKARRRGADVQVELDAAQAPEGEEPEPEEEAADAQMELDVAKAPARARASTAVPADSALGALSAPLPKQLKDAAVNGRKGQPAVGSDAIKALDKDDRLVLRQYRYLLGKPSTWGFHVDHAENLYWQPLLLTDAAGQTSIQFTLPDVVTTFRVLVDGHADGRIGSADGQVVSRTPSP